MAKLKPETSKSIQAIKTGKKITTDQFVAAFNDLKKVHGREVADLWSLGTKSDRKETEFELHPNPYFQKEFTALLKKI